MDYPFKEVVHHEYKNTFLKDVRVAVEFSIPKQTIRMENLQLFFNKFDGAKVKVDDFMKNQRVRVFSNDSMVDFHFETGYAEVKLCTPMYRTLEQSSGLWKMLQEYLEALQVEQINRLFVRKYSAFEFKINTINYDAKTVMNTVFCKELMDLMPKGNDYKMLTSLENTFESEDEKSKTSFRAVYGFKKSDTVEKPHQLSLVNLITSEDGAFATDEYSARVERYNKILFDAFHWCVKPEIINAMNQ